MLRGSITTISFFALGIISGIFLLLPEKLFQYPVSTYLVYLLIFLVGTGIGKNLPQVWETLKSMHIKILLVPTAAIIGTLAGTTISSVFVPSLRLSQCLAVGSGFGYYTLSSLMISQRAGDTLGFIALISNLLRETLTLIFAPLIVRLFGEIAPIAAGGATSMDITLPVICRASGERFAIVSILSGTVLTLLVPILVSFFLRK